jgi:hypothetical protein
MTLWEVGKQQRGSSRALADPIHRLRDVALSNDSQLESALSRKVEQGDADEHGDDALAGQHEHRHPGDEQDQTQDVLDGHETETHHGMLTTPASGRRSARGKVVRRQARDDQRHADQCRDEQRDGQREQPGRDDLVFSKPLDDSQSVPPPRRTGERRPAVAAGATIQESRRFSKAADPRQSRGRFVAQQASYATKMT